MTVQVLTENKSKAVLLAALTTAPQSVRLYDPSFVAERRFTGADIKPGERFPVVMDHPRRNRFAEIIRTPSGLFKVL